MSNSNSLPPSFLTQFKSEFGQLELEGYLTSLNKEKQTGIRIHPSKLPFIPFSKDSKERVRIPWTSQGYRLKNRPLFTHDPLFHAGFYYVQEPGAQFLDWILNHLPLPTPPTYILDACSAPGGKSLILSDWIESNGVVVANESDPKRAKKLDENIRRWGASNVILSRQKAEKLNSPVLFDLIVVDAPCSGEGMFRKDEFAIKQWSPDLVQDCKLVQESMIRHLWSKLKPGGWMIYITCTFNRTENEFHFNSLLESKEANSWRPTSLPKGCHSSNSSPSIRLMPHKTFVEGQTFTVLQKAGSSTSDQPTLLKRKNSLTNISLPTPYSSNVSLTNSVFEDKHCIRFCSSPTSMYLPFTHFPHFSVGVPIFDRNKSFLKPRNELALLDHKLNLELPKYELDDNSILNFLMGETLRITLPKGDHLITWKDLPIALGKGIQGRINSYWPPEWRIRMDVHATAAASVLI